MTKQQTIVDVEIAAQVAQALNQPVISLGPLSGGCVGEVYQSVLENGDRAVVKVDRREEPQLATEAFMLSYLRQHSSLPVPEVFYGSDRLLVISFLPGTSRFTPRAEEDLAGLVAELHNVTADRYGLEQDTLIGLLPQPNGWWHSWVDFFRQQRLLYLAHLAVEMERMPVTLLHRVEKMAVDLERWLDNAAPPSLIHGDLWSANVLAVDGRITGCIDPAIYYADPEVELTYMRLFNSFGEPFFQRYNELRPVRPGFYEERQHVYSLYPLLSHVCHFGGHYVAAVSEKLTRFGY
jgi:fructosamine-3-kinase